MTHGREMGRHEYADGFDPGFPVCFGDSCSVQLQPKIVPVSARRVREYPGDLTFHTHPPRAGAGLPGVRDKINSFERSDEATCIGTVEPLGLQYKYEGYSPEEGLEYSVDNPNMDSGLLEAVIRCIPRNEDFDPYRVSKRESGTGRLYLDQESVLGPNGYYDYSNICEWRRPYEPIQGHKERKKVRPTRRSRPR